MNSSIKDVRGIGVGGAATLAKRGIRTVEKLAGASVDEIAALKGFGSDRAKNIIRAAKALLKAKPEAATPTPRRRRRVARGTAVRVVRGRRLRRASAVPVAVVKAEEKKKKAAKKVKGGKKKKKEKKGKKGKSGKKKKKK